jgi:hypothetical protein
MLEGLVDAWGMRNAGLRICEWPYPVTITNGTDCSDSRAAIGPADSPFRLRSNKAASGGS